MRKSIFGKIKEGMNVGVKCLLPLGSFLGLEDVLAEEQ
jgi:hypothetical protein